MPPKRYFEELDQDSKVKPGVISDQLRKALGLHDDKLPIWIYRMRILGYPPGWLAKAKISKDEDTSLTIFDGNDKEIKPDKGVKRKASDLEDGEADDDDDDTGMKLPSAPHAGDDAYDPKQLIEYPGFNVPIPDGVFDHWRLINMPPMLRHQQLNYVKENLNMQTPEPKLVHVQPRFKKHKPNNDDDDESNDSVEMDDKVPSPANGHKPTEEESDIIVIPKPPKSPPVVITLDEDNEEKEEKVKEPSPQTSAANEASSNGKDNVEEREKKTSPIAPVEVSNASSSSCPSPSRDDSRQSPSAIPPPSNESTPSSSTPPPEKKMTLIGTGTPLPETVAKSKKPSLEKWAEGMGGLIYFENLPEYTGTFKKMRKVLGKVRAKLSLSSDPK